MRQRIVVSSLLFVFSSTVGAQQGPPLASGAQTKLIVGPNVQVGKQNSQQAEPFIAADPKNPNALIISVSEVLESPKNDGGAMLAESYITEDGGKSWSVSELPTMRDSVQSGRIATELDNWIVFAPNGDAFYTSLPFTSEGKAPIYVFRSVDKGRSWSGPTQIADPGYDQPKAAASLRGNRVRIYIAAASGGAALLSSDDNAKSFRTVGRVEPDNLRHQPMNPVLLPDGSALLPYTDFPDPEKQNLNFSRTYIVSFDQSSETFGLPHFVADVARPFPGGASFAADLSTGKLRGTIYAAWEDGDFGPRMVRQGDELVRDERGTRRDVAVAHSSDKGRTWSAPHILRSDGAGPSQFATLAVSIDGVLGVLWIQDEKYQGTPNCYRAWFAASPDGGDTFSQPTAVSDEVSCPDAKRNVAPFFKTRSRGGDYIGLAAAADGSFHAAWIDARDGAYRLYTTKIGVHF